jgi:hypothetical protein
MTEPEKPTPINRYLGIVELADRSCDQAECDQSPTAAHVVSAPDLEVWLLCDEHARWQRRADPWMTS